MENGRPSPPVDLRYLKTSGTSMSQVTGESVRARVCTFLEQIYTSQAETLPDIRDEPAEGDQDLQSTVAAVWTKSFPPDPYAEVSADIQDVSVVTKPSTPKMRKLRK